MRKPGLLVLPLLAMGLVALDAQAGVYTDDLSRCMVESTTESDRTDLVKWMFAAASAHPAVEPLASVSPQQISESNKTMADLLTRLLTRSCVERAKKAFQYEGAVALQVSMQVLGQVAGKELFSSPEVAAAMSSLGEYFDQEAIKAALEAK
jgi:hypothetical protein